MYTFLEHIVLFEVSGYHFVLMALHRIIVFFSMLKLSHLLSVTIALSWPIYPISRLKSTGACFRPILIFPATRYGVHYSPRIPGSL
jgi:hypothetical protein